MVSGSRGDLCFNVSTHTDQINPEKGDRGLLLSPLTFMLWGPTLFHLPHAISTKPLEEASNIKWDANNMWMAPDTVSLWQLSQVVLSKCWASAWRTQCGGWGPINELSPDKGVVEVLLLRNYGARLWTQSCTPPEQASWYLGRCYWIQAYNWRLRSP